MVTLLHVLGNCSGVDELHRSLIRTYIQECFTLIDFVSKSVPKRHYFEPNLKYLQRKNIPQILIFVFDRENYSSEKENKLVAVPIFTHSLQLHFFLTAQRRVVYMFMHVIFCFFTSVLSQLFHSSH